MDLTSRSSITIQREKIYSLISITLENNFHFDISTNIDDDDIYIIKMVQRIFIQKKYQFSIMAGILLLKLIDTNSKSKNNRPPTFIQ